MLRLLTERIVKSRPEIIDQTNTQGYTALDYANVFGKIVVAQLLVEYKANVSSLSMPVLAAAKNILIVMKKSLSRFAFIRYPEHFIALAANKSLPLSSADAKSNHGLFFVLRVCHFMDKVIGLAVTREELDEAYRLSLIKGRETFCIHLVEQMHTSLVIYTDDFMMTIYTGYAYESNEAIFLFNRQF
jgi:hypothetical protein